MNVYTQGTATSGFSTYVAVTIGESVALAMTIATDSGAVNLSGYSLKCQINFQTPLLLNTSNGGITITDAANGKIQLNMNNALTGSFRAGVYSYDLWMTSAGGITTPLLTGEFSVTPNISPLS